MALILVDLLDMYFISLLAMRQPSFLGYWHLYCQASHVGDPSQAESSTLFWSQSFSSLFAWDRRLCCIGHCVHHYRLWNGLSSWADGKVWLVKYSVQLRLIFVIALPAILASMVTSFGHAIVIQIVASFGTEAVTEYAVIGQIIPVAFCLLFAIFGAIDSIIGQNFGANRVEWVHKSLFDVLFFATFYSTIVSHSRAVA